MRNLSFELKKFKITATFFALLICVIFTMPCNAAVIAVNAGHQAKANLEKEPLGPGSKILKYKVAGGTCGIVSKMPEYELNLRMALLLEKELKTRGHEVIMVRRSNDVNISNSRRVAIAVLGGAEIIVNLHANAPGASQPKNMHGIMTLCRSKNNSFNAKIYLRERKLAEELQDKLCKATAAQNLGVIETDTMSGINYSPVPSVIVEAGYMTNAEEDLKLQSAEYRKTIAIAIADGIEQFLKTSEKQLTGKSRKGQ